MRAPVLSAFLCVAVLMPPMARGQEVLKPLATSFAEDNSFDRIALSPDGSFFAAVGVNSDKVGVWDAKTGFRVASLHAGKFSDPRTVAFSPDGKFIATGHEDHKVRLWAIDGWKVADSWDRHSETVMCLAFSGDGKRLASGGGDGTVCVCDTATGKLVAKLEGHREAVWSVVLNADGTRAVSSSEKRVQVWDVAKETVTAILQLKGPISGGRLAMSGDGKQVAVTDADRKGVTLWETDTGKYVDTLTGHADRVTGVAFTENDKLLVTSSRDGTVRTWELPGGKPKATWKRQKEGVACLAVSANGKVAVCGGVRTNEGIGGTLAVWQMAGEAEPKYVAGHSGGIRAVSFDGKGGMSSAGADERFLQWPPEGGYVNRIQQGKFGAHAHSPTGKHLAVTYSDKYIELCELGKKTPQELRGCRPDYVTGMRFLDGGKTLLTASSDDGGLRTWDVETAKLRDEGLDKQRDKVIALDVSKDEKRIVIAASGFIRSYKNPKYPNLNLGSYVQVLDGESKKTLWLAPVGGQRWINFERGTKEDTTYPVTDVRFTPNGKSVIGSGERGLQVFDAKTGDVLAGYSEVDVPNPQTNSLTRILNIDVSPDGKLFAACIEEWVKGRSKTQRVRVFSLSNDGGLNLLAIGEGHAVRPTVIAFRPDGKTLVTGDESGVIHFWDVSRLK